MNTNDYYGGTTILAAEFDGGVVLGADTRTSCRTYVSNRTADKLTRITDHIYCCRSGSAAQTQTLAESVGSSLCGFQNVSNASCLVRDAAVQFRNKIYSTRKLLLASIIVAGWDRALGGQVYTVPISGLLVPERYAMAGSGSSYIQGFMAAHFKPGLNQEDAVDVVKRAIRLAIRQDCSSGGVIRIGIITADGMSTSIYPKEDPDMHDKCTDSDLKIFGNDTFET
ncbi:uncharacterized protein Dmoj_GI19318 [Drosophila mojavensis]|uniref:proteasome endopeptidase complex n=2 Tax=Drosophila mojavensis TaxID=7230 RepID=B4KN71_DROMO|nr:uncharacterized protein Dmoj_GI19318 [Drosophila mojavensis]